MTCSICGSTVHSPAECPDRLVGITRTVYARAILAELVRRAGRVKLGETFHGGNLDNTSAYNALMFAARQVADITGESMPPACFNPDEEAIARALGRAFPDRLVPTLDAAGENPPGVIAAPVDCGDGRCYCSACGGRLPPGEHDHGHNEAMKAAMLRGDFAPKPPSAS